MRELRRQFAITQDLAKGIQPHKQVSFLSFFFFLITFIGYNTFNDNTYIYMEEK